MDHLAALDIAAVAKFGELAINLLVVGLPEESKATEVYPNVDTLPLRDALPTADAKADQRADAGLRI